MIKMRHQLDFADSLRRETSSVLGLPMRPYSIGMELELLRARSPFSTIQTFDEISRLPLTEKLRATIFAADVCSQSEAERAQSRRLLNNRCRWFDISGIAQRVRLKRIWQQWDLAVQKMNLDIEVQNFWNYLCVGKTGPEFEPAEGEDSGKPMGAPEMCVLLHYVRSLPASRISEWGCDLDFPIAIARYEYYTLLETQGKVALKSDFRQSFSDWCAEQDAKVASGEIKLPPIELKKE
jgi:hypothetical protein